jgi:iron complex transport system substrate-binding protein
MRRLLPLLVACGWLGQAAAQEAGPYFLGEARPGKSIGRVISLAPNLTEILFALGLGDRVVGVTIYDDYPEQVKNLPRVGGFIDPSLEAILGLSPDLVLCVPNSGGRDRMEALARMDIPTLVVPSYQMEDLFRAIDRIGALFDRVEPARQLAITLRGRMDAVTRRVDKLSRPKVLMVYGHEPLFAAGKGSFADFMLQVAGGKNVLGDSKVPYPTVPLEVVVTLEPEVIIDASSSGTGAEKTAGEVTDLWNRWSGTPAATRHQVHVFDSALWFRLSPRIVDGIEKLAEILHPDMSHTAK